MPGRDVSQRYSGRITSSFGPCPSCCGQFRQYDLPFRVLELCKLGRDICLGRRLVEWGALGHQCSNHAFGKISIRHAEDSTFQDAVDTVRDIFNLLGLDVVAPRNNLFGSNAKAAVLRNEMTRLMSPFRAGSSRYVSSLSLGR